MVLKLLEARKFDEYKVYKLDGDLTETPDEAIARWEEYYASVYRGELLTPSGPPRALAPELSNKAVEQARLTLQTLGAEAESDELAAIRYSDLKQDDGTFLWGVSAAESASCKGGNQTFSAGQTAWNTESASLAGVPLQLSSLPTPFSSSATLLPRSGR